MSSYLRRTTLEINAFKEINLSINKLSHSLSKVHVKYLMLPIDLKNHLENPRVFLFDREKIRKKLVEQSINLYQRDADFILSIESNEIIVIEFDHYRKFIYLRFKELQALITDFLDYISSKETEEFIEKTKEISEKTMDIQSFLYDYRIILMNAFLEEIFETKVPVRIPDFPYKTLEQLATKEIIEKEWKEDQDRIKNAYNI